jgi:hypothetical protein
MDSSPHYLGKEISYLCQWSLFGSRKFRLISVSAGTLAVGVLVLSPFPNERMMYAMSAAMMTRNDEARWKNA